MNLVLRDQRGARLDLGQVRAYLAQCDDLDAVRDIRDQAQAIAHVSRTREHAQGLAVDAAAIAVRAERRLGELLSGIDFDKGGRPAKTGVIDTPVSVTLADLGFSKNDSRSWQSLARVDADAFERELEACVAAGKPPTRAALLRLAEPAAEEEPEPFHVLVALGVLRKRLETVVASTRAEWPRDAHAGIAMLLRELATELEMELAE